VSEHIFLTTTADSEDKIYAKREDVAEICQTCPGCNGEDLEDGCGCILAYTEICYKGKPIFYGSNLKEEDIE